MKPTYNQAKKAYEIWTTDNELSLNEQLKSWDTLAQYIKGEEA